MAAYEEAQVLEPDNKGTKASLAQARSKIADLEKKSQAIGMDIRTVSRRPKGSIPASSNDDIHL